MAIRRWEKRVNSVNEEAARTGVHPDAPEPGSALFLDNEEVGFCFPAVSNALTQSVDHLAAIVDLIEARPQLRVFAYPSLFRGALLGSAEALWLMGPADRATRTARARLLSAEELRNHAAFAADYPEDPDATAAVYRERYQSEVQELKRVGAPTRYEATAVIREAGKSLPLVLGVPDDSGRDLVSEWRMMSAQAHGRTWDKRYRAGYVRGEYQGEHRISGNVGTVKTLGRWMSVTIGVTLAAWSLFDDGRREAP